MTPKERIENHLITVLLGVCIGSVVITFAIMDKVYIGWYKQELKSEQLHSEKLKGQIQTYKELSEKADMGHQKVLESQKELHAKEQSMLMMDACNKVDKQHEILDDLRYQLKFAGYDLDKFHDKLEDAVNNQSKTEIINIAINLRGQYPLKVI
jgi:hypothetical protein